MTVPRNSLRGFLAQARAALRTAIDSNQKITFVIGNESSDLDSMTCSILYAYIRSMVPPRNAFAPIYVPINNIPASGIQLRPEFLELFKHANIESRHLLTLDDLPELPVLKSKLPPENTKWILVDHNALQGQLGKVYAERVGGVIDHHDEEGRVPKETGDEPRIVEKSGSCTSLVTNYLRCSWDVLSSLGMSSGAAYAQGGALSGDSTVAKVWDAEAAQLGLASILIDTANLQDNSKTTDHDRKAVEYLEARILTCPKLAASFDRTKFYEQIDAARKDIGGMQLQNILQKDYKLWDDRGQKLGISSVVRNIDFLRKKAAEEAKAQSMDEAFLGALHGFATERELDLYSVMTTSTSAEGQFQRELLVWAFSEVGIAAAKKFAKDSHDELGLEEWQSEDGTAFDHTDDGYWRRVWWQRNVQHSRKRVAPLLREAMT
ncbi:exopolyphosphatase-like protein [Bimuria novae-zelandiae CBS 107.79]|uniref:Exopolyphosphatase-like protein n=1 Tax=Bimuria novae-zelandiae CBS 107.79 TaxID=1447943 RepID=A0A6A5URI3_9PLEO|nr:exopolyphosphatase-like protein [Bimuria novae-zelandiae CBS 107.79]